MKSPTLIFAIASILVFDFFAVIRSRQTKMLIEIFRHGARNPIEDIAFFHLRQGKEYLGDLTITGIRQHFNLGRLVYKKYKEFFQQDIYGNPHAVEFYSSDRQRTVASLESHLSGLFEANSEPKLETSGLSQLWTPPSVSVADAGDSSAQKFQSIGDSRAVPSKSIWPIRMDYKETGFYFLANHTCPVAVAKYDDFNRSRVKDYLPIFQPTLDLLAAHGYDTRKMFPGEQLLMNYASLASHIITEFWNKPNATLDYNLLLHTQILESVLLKVLTRDELVHKLTTYKMFRRISANLSDLSGGRDYKKLLVFSGHDDNINILLTELLNPKSLQCVVDNYRDVLLKSNIESREDYLRVLDQMTANNCYPITPFASNLIFEVYQGS